jgi:catechol 2,3-dioxygenase-like lactoylglutathione lyase family enzyme
MPKKKSKPKPKATSKAKPPAKSRAKSAAPKSAAGKSAAPKSAALKSAALKPAAPKTRPARPAKGAPLSFNHAMVYCRDVERSLGFYHDILGMKMLDEFRYEGKAVYARLVAPGGEGTIALHQAGPGASVAADGVRLYFEIEDLDNFCQQVKRKGIYFSQLPQMMPWGWRHAYLNDYDGHEISLFWAGPNRMKKTVMSAGNRARREA